MTDRFQTKPLQQRCSIWIKTQRFYRQPTQLRFPIVSPSERELQTFMQRRLRSRLPRISRERPCRPWRRRDRRAYTKALCIQSGCNFRAQTFFAAEEMSTACYVEKKPFRRIDDHNWCKSLAPRGNIVERAGIFFRLRLNSF
ncbi:MAG: hypothetical protein ABL871_12745 [Terricaulis sp.]